MTDAHKPDTITVTIRPVNMPDPRPEPGPLPTLYAIRYWEWEPQSQQWKARLNWGLDEDRVSKDAKHISAEGCRRVQIVTIPGDVK